jgi:hypothetical protein
VLYKILSVTTVCIARGVRPRARSYHAREVDWLVRTIDTHGTLRPAQPGHAPSARWALRSKARDQRRGGGAAAPTVEDRDWGTTRVAPVEDWSRRTSGDSEKPAGGIDLLRSGQSSDSESRSLRTGGLGPLPGRVSLACSVWSEERGVGRSWLDWVGGG